MKIEILSKKEAKIAEQETTHISNLLYTKDAPSSKGYNELSLSIRNMHNWLYNEKSNLNKIKQAKDWISTKLGKPLYHSTYEFREVIWGIKLNSTRIIILYSKKGFSVQIEKNSTLDNASSILNHICLLLETHQ